MGRAAVDKTTRITVETESVLIVRHATISLAWCPECRAEVDVITLNCNNPADPAALARLQASPGAGKLHLWQPATGPARVCVPSLLQCFELEEVRRFLFRRRTL